MRIHIRPLVSTAALSLGLAFTAIPGALAQEPSDGGPVQRWPSAESQGSQSAGAPGRVAVARDTTAARPAPQPAERAADRQRPADRPLDAQLAGQRQLEQRRDRAGGGQRDGGGRSGGGIRSGAPGGAAPRVAVPRRGAPPTTGRRGTVVVPRGYYGAPYYYPYYSYSYFGPGFYSYDAYWLGSAGWGPGWGWGGPGWRGAYGGYYGGGYGYGYDLGRLRLQVKPRDAEVFIDGYYAGQVDDFDGRLQGLSLETGGYSVEIRKQGWETLTFDVRVTPGRTTTYRGELIPQKP